jgi:hypothetical protein
LLIRTQTQTELKITKTHTRTKHTQIHSLKHTILHTQTKTLTHTRTHIVVHLANDGICGDLGNLPNFILDPFKSNLVKEEIKNKFL